MKPMDEPRNDPARILKPEGSQATGSATEELCASPSPVTEGPTGSSRSPQPKGSQLTVSDLNNLRHMLGVEKRTPRGYRNYFVAGADSVPSMERLKAHGFVVKNERYGLSSDPCYHATVDGARAIGLERLPR